MFDRWREETRSDLKINSRDLEIFWGVSSVVARCGFLFSAVMQANKLQAELSLNNEAGCEWSFAVNMEAIQGTFPIKR